MNKMLASTCVAVDQTLHIPIATVFAAFAALMHCTGRIVSAQTVLESGMSNFTLDVDTSVRVGILTVMRAHTFGRFASLLHLPMVLVDIR